MTPANFRELDPPGYWDLPANPTPKDLAELSAKVDLERECHLRIARVDVAKYRALLKEKWARGQEKRDIQEALRQARFIMDALR